MNNINQKEYHVIWEIEVSAPNPRVAAELALEIQQDTTSTATVFDVFELSGAGTDHYRVTRVDLRRE